MTKLYFRYGAMNSAKTLNLLAVAHNYQDQSKKILIMKPMLDTRDGIGVVKSRTGLHKNVDILLKTEYEWSDDIDLNGIKCILVDEVQFLDPKYIDKFREIVDSYGIPVICYGLRTDFKTLLFPGAKRLLELADTIEEIKTTCWKCCKKATMNMRVNSDGNGILDGPSVLIGGEELYRGVCSSHYYEMTK